MFRKTTIRGLFLFFIITLIHQEIRAQSAFWEEDFSSGIPAGWTRDDLSGSMGFWTWCSMPSETNPQPPGCPFVWLDNTNQQTAFASTTAQNGFVAFDSDEHGYQTNHNSFIASNAIDCSGENEVWLKFETTIGVIENPTAGHAVVEVSLNGMDWVNFNWANILPGDTNPGLVRWSFNPHFAIVDISSIAANQPEVYVRWRWASFFEFYWAIDDIAFFDEDPSCIIRPNHDMHITTCFAIAPNYSTPISQVEQFGFLADLMNIGSKEQTGVKLFAQIEDVATGDVLIRDSLEYGSIASDSLAANMIFPGPGFLPQKAGLYSGFYEVVADSADVNPVNNTKSFEFEVSDFTFAKENGITSYTSPVDVAWIPNFPKSWGWGNYFYVNNGTDFIADKVQFSIQGNLANLAGQDLEINFYGWQDDNNDFNAQIDERILLDRTLYTITGSEPIFQFIEVNLNGGKGVQLADKRSYIVMVEYHAPNNQDIVNIGFSNENDYTAMHIRSDVLNEPRFLSFLWIGNPGVTDFSSLGFGFRAAPAIRLVLDQIVATHPGPSVLTGNIDLKPNPVKDILFAELDFGNEKGEIEVQIVSANGRVMQERKLSSRGKNTQQFGLENLAPGNYFLRVQRGTRQAIKEFVKIN